MISVGLLGLMMTLAGQVFSIAVDSTNQATALMNVSQSMRLLEETLRADLRNVNPSRSMLVIDAHAIDAYWTSIHQDGDAGGDPSDGFAHDGDAERELTGQGINGANAPPARLERPRADVLMFFTSRNASSAVYPEVRSSNVQVVYGHAELGEYLDDGTNIGTWDVEPLPFTTSPTNPPPDYVDKWDPAVPLRDRYFARNWHLARRQVLLVDYALDSDGADDLLGININDQAILTPDEGQGPDYPLRDGILDIISKNAVVDPFFFENEVAGDLIPNAVTLARWYRRSRLDETPPPSLYSRLGAFFLPHCASFKVEWALSHPSIDGNEKFIEVIWVDPADVQASVIALIDSISPPDPELIPLKNEFQAGGRFDPMVVNGTHEFFAVDPTPGATDEPDLFFPRALRITVDLYDEAGEFDKPIRHVMVLPVGEG